MSQVAKFFDATIAKGSDVKLVANWIMRDIAAYMKNEKLTINEIKLIPQELAKLIASIKGGIISGKIGKEVRVCLCTNDYYILHFKFHLNSDVLVDHHMRICHWITFVNICPSFFVFCFLGLVNSLYL